MSPRKKRATSPESVPLPDLAEAVIAEPVLEPAPRSFQPRIDVLERRLAEPFGTGSTPIRLKDPSMTLRWINGAQPGRIDRAKNIQGWVPVLVSELEDPDAIPGLTPSADGFVRRGERGQVVLMKMPRDIYERIQRRKTDVLMARQTSSSKSKQDMAQAAAKRYGAEAGDYIGGLKGEVIDSREAVTKE